MKFYETNQLFDNVGFADLCNECGILAEAKENGVWLDAEKYLSMKLFDLPFWLYQNRPYIKKL